MEAYGRTVFYIIDMGKGECTICNHKFDGKERRPRSLPCGHGFCGKCIDACIARGNNTCPVCRESHGADSAPKLPVNFPLEEMLQKATVSTEHESDINSDEETVDICSKHKGIALHFQCKSHNLKVCHSCAVIDHPPSSCKLVALDDHFEENKKLEILAVQKRRERIMDIKKDLKNMQRNIIVDVTKQKIKKRDIEKQVELLLINIKEVDQEIAQKQISEESIVAAMQCCQDNHKEFQLLESKLRTTKGNRKIQKECQVSANEITKNEKWEEKLRSDLNMNKDTHAQVERNAILRSSKVIYEGKRILVPSLSKNVKPPTGSELMQEAKLRLTSSSMTVFLDLSVRGGCNLGRVEVRVFTDRPEGK